MVVKDHLVILLEQTQDMVHLLDQVDREILAVPVQEDLMVLTLDKEDLVVLTLDKEDLVVQTQPTLDMELQEVVSAEIIL